MLLAVCVVDKELRSHTFLEGATGLERWKINFTVKIDRHNNVLLLIATAIKEHINDLRKKPDKKDRCRLITCIPAGHRPPSNRSTSVKGLLAQASLTYLNFGFLDPATYFLTRFVPHR